MMDRFCDITGWRNRIHLEYWIALRNVINPGGDNKTGLYPCCGADALAFFLTTDAQKGYFVDQITFNPDNPDSCPETTIDREYYWKHKELGGNMGGGFSWTILLQEMRFLKRPLVWELEAMGAEDILIGKVDNNQHQVDFTWAHWASHTKKRRSIVFFSKVDTRYPLRYPEGLKRLLAEGIDFYMEKAAKDHYANYNAPLDWGTRWQQFKSFAKFNGGSVIITTSRPDRPQGRVFASGKSADELERKGARFGVWPAVLLSGEHFT